MTAIHDVIDLDETRMLDPTQHPELYDNVRTRRISAFLVDAVIMVVLMTVSFVAITFLGLFTLGLGWLLFGLIWPVVPILYTMFTLGSSESATPGMRAMGIEMRTFDGGRMYSLLAFVHAVLFWFSVTVLTPFVLLVSLFSPRKRLLHDIVLGTTVIRRDDGRL
ncbi:RDD family protein [Afifella sp. H1R]|uniref:RDD family protein n=1 Tax=unclassified Afifella TaxID=2624128 RepID=UPI001F257054|nr:RDD family protein [Afifella sp. H1R]MCF1502785.1 RDD family protein [Afifella sp. H1R]